MPNRGVHKPGTDQARDLRERIKELDCLRGIATLFAERAPSLEATLRAAADLVMRGWQYPEMASVRISLRGLDVRTPGHGVCVFRMRHPIAVAGEPAGEIEVAYPPSVAGAGRTVFLDSETQLLAAVCVLIGTMVELESGREALERQAAELRARRAALSRKNVALREVLSQLESDKRLLSKRLRSTVTHVILPLVAKLKLSSLSPSARDRYILLVESHLRELAVSCGEKGVADLAPRLSPREVEVADLVRSGIGSKEMAEMLGVSESTVERHRHNIRRKLGIDDPSVNLASFLSDL